MGLPLVGLLGDCPSRTPLCTIFCAKKHKSAHIRGPGGVLRLPILIPAIVSSRLRLGRCSRVLAVALASEQRFKALLSGCGHTSFVHHGMSPNFHRTCKQGLTDVGDDRGSQQEQPVGTARDLALQARALVRQSLCPVGWPGPSVAWF